MVFGLYFLASLILIIVGNILYIPQYYAYSQVEFLLCYSLDLGQASPRRILKTSRSFMKGYKFQHFVLDLQLLPWYFLNWITFDIASFYSYLISNVLKSAFIEQYLEQHLVKIPTKLPLVGLVSHSYPTFKSIK